MSEIGRYGLDMCDSEEGSMSGCCGNNEIRENCLTSWAVIMFRGRSLLHAVS
jgi:hypothetical protein